MTKADKKSEELEILLSTMNRTSLSFLSEMFPVNSLLNQRILVINQTTEDKFLSSNNENVRIVNSFQKGLPQSRNLAIREAVNDICLVADDDVKYIKGFEQTITSAFQKHQDADIITFQMTDDKGNLFRAYENVIVHNKNSIKMVNSVVIAFRKQNLIDNDVFFNTNFGLGSTFETANEYVFLRNALRANLKVYFEPQIILSHKFYSSGKDAGSDRIVYARSALFYKYSGILGYLRICKYLFLIYKQKHISFNEIISKMNVGLKGIKEYKRLLREGLEIR